VIETALDEVGVHLISTVVSEFAPHAVYESVNLKLVTVTTGLNHNIPEIVG
jgi:hypothetical protein